MAYICPCPCRWPWPWYKLTLGRQMNKMSAELSRQQSKLEACSVKLCFTWPWLWKHVYGLANLFSILNSQARWVLSTLSLASCSSWPSCSCSHSSPSPPSSSHCACARCGMASLQNEENEAKTSVAILQKGRSDRCRIQLISFDFWTVIRFRSKVPVKYNTLSKTRRLLPSLKVSSYRVMWRCFLSCHACAPI